MAPAELIVAALVIGGFFGLLVSVVASNIAVERFMRGARADVVREKQEVASANKFLDERRALIRNMENDLRIREEAVALFGRGVKKAAATIEAERAGVDTMITKKGFDDLPAPPKPDDWEKTIEMPAVQDGAETLVDWKTCDHNADGMNGYCTKCYTKEGPK
jgi:hypothetical protein